MKKVITIMMLFVVFNTYATNRVSTGSTNWSVASTWSPSGIPAAGDNLTILNGHNVKVVAPGQCANLTINTGGTLTFNANVVITVNGNYTLTGSESGTGQLQFSGAGTTLTATGTVSASVRYIFNSSRTISASSVISKTSSTTQINAGFTVNNLGSYTMGNSFAAATGQWTNTGTLTLNINGFLPTGAGIFDASPSGNTVIINYATGNIPKTTSGYANLTVSGSGIKSLLQNLNTSNNLIISAGATLDASNFNITVGGNWTKNGSFTASANHSVTFNSSSAAQTISGSGTTTFEQLTISNTSGLFSGVSINSGSYILNDVLTMNSGNFFTNGNSFTMISDATRTARIAPVAATCNISGFFTINRYITTRDTTYADLSSPVQSSTFVDWNNELPGISYTSYPGSSVPTQFTWSESANNYVDVTSSGTALTPGLGFEVFLSGDYSYSNFPNTTINTVGVPNYGDQNLSSLISFTASYPNGSSNLVGNPFASSISWDAVYAASSNLDPIFDFYDYTTGTYVNHSLGEGAAGEIGSTQGFWVYTLNPGATLIIPESAKTTSSNSSLRANIQPSYFTLKISNAENKNKYSQTLKVAASPLATDGFDIGKDHWFRKSPLKAAPNLYTFIDGNKSVINVFNSNDETYEMPISTEAGVSGYYKIDAVGFELLNDYTCIQLEDKFLNKLIDLKTEPSYTFRLNSTDIGNRFMLHLSKNGNCKSLNTIPASSTSNNQTEILATPFGNIINFNLNETFNTTINVTNLIGQNIIDAKNIEAFNQSVNINLPEGFSGMYLLKIESANGTIVKKFVKR